MILLQAVADGRLGGGTTHVLQLIDAVRAALPLDVHLVSQTASPALAEAARRGAVVHGLDFFTSRFDPRIWLTLDALVRRLGPALIHAHGARAGLPLTRAAGRTPMIYSVHGYHFVGKTWPARALAIRAERRCSGRADMTVFVCEHDRRLAETAGILARAARYRVIPNGIELDGLPQAAGGGGFRRLAFLGRLVEVKNPLFALEVLRALGESGYRLVVVGDGPLMGEMRRRAAALGLADRVELRGGLERAQALEALATCDLLIVPSLWEGMPLAPLEAMAMGIPVVASAVGGLPEIIEHERSGMLIDGHEPDRYAQAIRRLDEAPELRAEIVARARAVVAERFAWPVTRQAYLAIYREFLERR